MNVEDVRTWKLKVECWKYKVEIGSAEVGSWKLEVQSGNWKRDLEVGIAKWPIGHGSKQRRRNRDSSMQKKDATTPTCGSC